MGMGLQAAYGADALQQNLRQRIMDQIAAQQRDREFAQQQFQNNRLTANDQRAAEEHKATMQSLADQRAAGQQQMAENEAAKGTAGLSVGQSIPAPMVGRLRGTMQAANIQDNPPLAQPNVPGMMQPDIVPGQQPGAVWTGNDKQRTDEENKQIRGRLLSSPDVGPRERLAIEMENAGMKVPAGIFDNTKKPTGPLHDTPTGLVRVAEDNTTTPVLGPDGKQLKSYHAPQQPVVVQMPTGPGLLDRGTGVAKPVKDAAGNDVGVRPSGTMQTRLASAQAVNQTGDDIVAKLSDPNFAAVVGPAMGRFSSLRDFIGNPPPEFSELAGQIESYALASMGVHGMRSAQGAEKISKLLDAHHTPESLAATIKGLNQFSAHFMQNEGRGGASTSAPATAPASAATPKRIRYDINGKVIP